MYDQLGEVLYLIIVPCYERIGLFQSTSSKYYLLLKLVKYKFSVGITVHLHLLSHAARYIMC